MRLTLLPLKSLTQLFYYSGLSGWGLDKEILFSLISNLRLNYSKATKIPRLLILLLVILNNRSPLAFFRRVIPAVILTFIDKLFYMHLSFARDFGLISDNKPQHQNLDQSCQDDIIYDYAIIGSGAGAGVAAISLPNDKKVLILEKGGNSAVDVGLRHTLANMILDFADCGMQVVWGKKLINISQGETLGGGSVINSGLYKKLSGKNRTELLDKLSISEEDFFRAENFVEGILKPVLNPEVIKEESLLFRAGTLKDISVEEVPRWRRKEAKGWVNNSIKDLIWDHQKYIIYSHFEVDSIASTDHFLTITGNRKVNEKTEEKVFKAKKVIFSAGTTSTPKLLVGSGYLDSRKVSFNFAPMLRVFAKVSEGTLGDIDIDPFQCYDKLKGLKFGSGVSTPSLISGLLGREFSRKEASTIRSYYVSFKATGNGGMLRGGNFYYNFTKKDIEKGREALSELMAFVRLGGGDFSLYNQNSNPKLEFSSVHIFGSLPWGSSFYQNDSTVLKIEPRICVIDASILPLAPEINPQALVMVLSKLAIERAINNGF